MAKYISEMKMYCIDPSNQLPYDEDFSIDLSDFVLLIQSEIEKSFIVAKLFGPIFIYVIFFKSFRQKFCLFERELSVESQLIIFRFPKKICKTTYEPIF